MDPQELVVFWSWGLGTLSQFIDVLNRTASIAVAQRSLPEASNGVEGRKILLPSLELPGKEICKFVQHLPSSFMAAAEKAACRWLYRA